MAFGAMNSVVKSAFFGVPFDEHIFGALELVGRDFEASAAVFFTCEPEFFKAEFVMNFGGYSGLSQALVNRLRLGTVLKERNRCPIHRVTSSSAAENQGGEDPKLLAAKERKNTERQSRNQEEVNHG